MHLCRHNIAPHNKNYTHKKTAHHTGDGLKTQGVDGERRERREATTGSMYRLFTQRRTTSFV